MDAHFCAEHPSLSSLFLKVPFDLKWPGRSSARSHLKAVPFHASFSCLPASATHTSLFSLFQWPSFVFTTQRITSPFILTLPLPGFWSLGSTQNERRGPRVEQQTASAQRTNCGSRGRKAGKELGRLQDQTLGEAEEYPKRFTPKPGKLLGSLARVGHPQ